MRQEVLPTFKCVSHVKNFGVNRVLVSIGNICFFSHNARGQSPSVRGICIGKLKRIDYCQRIGKADDLSQEQL